MAFGLTGSLQKGRSTVGGRQGSRHRYRALTSFGLYIALSWILPGRKRVVPYSIQTLMRLKPALFRQDLVTLFDLLHQHKIKPVIATRFPLIEVKKAHELLGSGGVTGKIVLLCSEASNVL